MEVADKCPWCGFPAHAEPPSVCPYVKAIEFGRDGLAVKMPAGQVALVTRVEFLTPADMGKAAQKEEEPQPDYPRLGRK